MYLSVAFIGLNHSVIKWSSSLEYLMSTCYCTFEPYLYFYLCFMTLNCGCYETICCHHKYLGKYFCPTFYQIMFHTSISWSIFIHIIFYANTITLVTICYWINGDVWMYFAIFIANLWLRGGHFHMLTLFHKILYFIKYFDFLIERI